MSEAKKEEPELGKDMREEYRRVVEELGLVGWNNLTYATRGKLSVVKKKIALLLQATVCGDWADSV